MRTKVKEMWIRRIGKTLWVSHGVQKKKKNITGAGDREGAVEYETTDPSYALAGLITTCRREHGSRGAVRKGASRTDRTPYENLQITGNIRGE